MSPKRPLVKSNNLDHLGLVAARYDELGIGDVIDEAIEPDLEKRKVSLGQAVKAMVLNGLLLGEERNVNMMWPVTLSVEAQLVMSMMCLISWCVLSVRRGLSLNISMMPWDDVLASKWALHGYVMSGTNCN
jgi:hypothetical protein